MEKIKSLEDKIPFKQTIIKAINIILPNWQRASVTSGAAEMAYFILLSLIPIILMVANIIPLLPMNQGQVLGIAQNIVPANVYSIVEPTLVGYLESGSGGAITVGAIAAIWSASKIIQSLRIVLEEIYGTVEAQNFVIGRIISMFLMFLIILIIGGAVFAFVFGEQILLLVQSLIGIQLPFIDAFLAMRYVFLLIPLFFIFIIMYQYVPNHHLKIKYTIPGAIFSTLGWLLLTQFFSLYVSLTGGDAVANATLGSFIVLMLFLYLSSIILLLGALVNVIVFEWTNGESVMDYEIQYRRDQALADSNYTGYPREEEVTMLKRQVFKVKPLTENEVEQIEVKENRKNKENGMEDEVKDI